MESELVATEGDTGVVRVEVWYGDPVKRHYRDLWIVRLNEPRPLHRLRGVAVLPPQQEPVAARFAKCPEADIEGLRARYEAISRGDRAAGFRDVHPGFTLDRRGTGPECGHLHGRRSSHPFRRGPVGAVRGSDHGAAGVLRARRPDRGAPAGACAAQGKQRGGGEPHRRSLDHARRQAPQARDVSEARAGARGRRA